MPYLDAPYSAGIIDGEGSIMIGRSNQPKVHYYPMVSMANTSLELVECFVDTFGGKCYVTRGNTSTRKVLYAWSLQSRNSVKECLEIILPWLIIKKARAELVLEYIAQTMNHGQANGRVPPEEIALRESYYHRVREAV